MFHAVRTGVGDNTDRASSRDTAKYQMHFSALAKWLQRTSSTDDPEQDDHNGDYQKNMDETAERVRSDQSKNPQNKKNNCNCIKHDNYPFMLLIRDPTGSVQVNRAVGQRLRDARLLRLRVDFAK